jgi:hypothetical protein
VERAKPEVIVHQLTAIGIEGRDHLLSASQVHWKRPHEHGALPRHASRWQGLAAT